VTLDDVVALIPDGASLATGGVLMAGKPVALLDALGRARRDLTLWTMLGSIDAEILAARGALSTCNAIYVGFEQHGFAPAYGASVERGEVVRNDYSEFLFMSGIRAGMAGLPFLPTRGGTGSQVTADLGIRTVACPYTGEEILAAPAIRPDFALLHAPVADAAGNVPAPAEPGFLFDYDANVARAAERVIVSVERVVASVSGPLLLYAHEVDAVVEAPGGAPPGSLAGEYGPDIAALRAYLDGGDLEALCLSTR
jgi:glutaconate CoA-transferase subunit A